MLPPESSLPADHELPVEQDEFDLENDSYDLQVELLTWNPFIDIESRETNPFVQSHVQSHNVISNFNLEKTLKLGVYKKDGKLQYYNIGDLSTSLSEQELEVFDSVEDLLAKRKETIKDKKNARIYLVGHANGHSDGISGDICEDERDEISEEITNAELSKCINGVQNLIKENADIHVAVVSCNYDNREQAKNRDDKKTNLERLYNSLRDSLGEEKLKNITVKGTAPFDEKNEETGLISNIIGKYKLIGRKYRADNSRSIIFADKENPSVMVRVFAKPWWNTRTAISQKKNLISFINSISKESKEKEKFEAWKKKILLNPKIRTIKDISFQKIPGVDLSDIANIVEQYKKQELENEHKNISELFVKLEKAMQQLNSEKVECYISVLVKADKELGPFRDLSKIVEEYLTEIKQTKEEILFAAAKMGFADIVEKVLARGANVNLKNQDGETALMIAAKNGYDDVVENLLVGGADVNLINNDGETALMMAAKSGHTNIVEKFLDRSSDVNITNKDGKTALILAVKNGHADVVESFLVRGANVNLTNEDGETLLMLAVTTKSVDVVEKLIARGADVNFKDGIDYTALMKPSFIGLSDIVKELLKKDNIDLNAKAIDGETALMMAAYNGNAEVVKQLLAIGADINLKRNDGETALTLAVKSGDAEIIKMILLEPSFKDNNGVPTLILAAQFGYAEVVKQLLKKNADVNLSNCDGVTALMLAAERGHAEVVKQLLAKGANVNLSNCDGVTALMAAAKNGYAEVVEKLLAKGADVNSKTNGVTALMLAAERGHAEVVKQLLAKGADVNSTTDDRVTALMLAAARGSVEVVKQLLEKNADVNLSNCYGVTVLMTAANNGHAEVVEQLLAKGAYVNSKTNGVTALMLAAKRGHAEAVEQLLAKDADVNSTNDDGETALMMAAKIGHTEIVKKISYKLRGQDKVNLNAEVGLAVATNNLNKILAPNLHKTSKMTASDKPKVIEELEEIIIQQEVAIESIRKIIEILELNLKELRDDQSKPIKLTTHVKTGEESKAKAKAYIDVIEKLKKIEKDAPAITERQRQQQLASEQSRAVFLPGFPQKQNPRRGKELAPPSSRPNQRPRSTR